MTMKHIEESLSAITKGAPKEKAVKRKKTKKTPPGGQSNAFKTETTRENELHVQNIDILNVIQDGQLVREQVDDDHVIELATSISRHGLLEPIVVQPTENGMYQLLAGHHRLLACKRLKWTAIPANVRSIDDQSPVKSLAMIENIARKNMSLSEEVEAVLYLYDHENMSPSQITQLIGKSRAWVDRRLALPSLNSAVAAALFDGQITISVAEELSKIKDDGILASLLNEAIYAKRTLQEVKQLVEIARAAPNLEEAIEKGTKTAAELEAKARVGRACDNCGTFRDYAEIRAYWICSDGCPEEPEGEEK